MYVTSSRSVAGILGHAARSGVDTSALAKAVGLAPSIAGEQPWVATTQLLALHEAAARASGDDAFGLHLAEAVTLEMLTGLGVGAARTVTVGEAIDRTTRLLRRWTNAAEVTVSLDGATARVQYRLLEATPAVRHDAEATVAMFVVLARAAGLSRGIREVAFAHPRPERTREHERVLGTAVRFQGQVNAVVFERECLDHPLVDARSASGAQPLLPQALAQPLSLPPVTLPDRVRRAIAVALGDGQVDLLGVADGLATSGRTLQRRLAERDTSFEQLLDEVRHQLALVYLNAGGHRADELAAMLGFAERSPFHRAFRRWTGTTPGRYLAATSGLRPSALPGR